MRYSLSVKFNKDFVEVDEAARIITIGIRAKPVKGKANEEIVKKLAQAFRRAVVQRAHRRGRAVENQGRRNYLTGALISASCSPE
jgi:uncharacterized protein YggU (UPF0235/DUF167 family)